MYSIQRLSSVEELREVEEIQRGIWSIQDATEVVPLHLLGTAQMNGGLVLGAFSEGEMIGVLFGFLGRTEGGQWKHCSHMMGVLPDYRRGGVGEALKRRQREFVLEQGLDLITWTVDPLEGVNATLNFSKLGGVSRTYHRSLYGQMRDGLNRGLPSDRFGVEWWISSQRVEQRLRPEIQRSHLDDLREAGAQLVNPTRVRGELREPQDASIRTDASLILVEIPASFQAIKSTSLDLALDWRENTRTVFEAYFEAGYIASEFFSVHEDSERRNFYLLQRTVPGLSL